MAMAKKPTRREAVAARSRLINEAEDQVAAVLQAAAAQAAAVLASAPSDYTLWVVSAMQGEIRRVLEEHAERAAEIADAAQLSAWQAGAALIDAEIAAPRLAATLSRIDVRQIEAMREFTVNKIKAVTLEAAGKINNSLATTMTGLQTPFDAVQQITETLGESTRKRATGIVRTELGTAYSTASHLRREQWAQAVPGLKKRWVKSGKVNPRIEHVAVHGQTRDIDQPFELEGGAVLMMHPHDPNAPAGHRINCGCVAVTVVSGYARTIIDEKEKELEADAERGRAALRAARE